MTVGEVYDITVAGREDGYIRASRTITAIGLNRVHYRIHDDNAETWDDLDHIETAIDEGFWVLARPAYSPMVCLPEGL